MDKHGIHYVALYASYNVKVSFSSNGKQREITDRKLTLLACSPMAGLPEDTDDLTNDQLELATSFCAGVQANFIKQTFAFYDGN